MKRLLALVCPLLLASCSAEIAVDTPPQTHSIPITSAGWPAYAEVAIDLPPELQGYGHRVKELSATLTVHNPSERFALTTSARLSLVGNATPDKSEFYTDESLPEYYEDALELLEPSEFAPASRTAVTIDSSALIYTLHNKRVWVIFSNTVTGLDVGTPTSLDIQLENIALHAAVTKYFAGVEGALGPGGL